MPDSRLNSSSAVIIILIVAIFAFSIPAIFTAQETPDSKTFEQNADTVVTLSTDLDASLDNIESPPNGLVNVTLINTATGETTFAEIAESSNQTVTLSGKSITIYHEETLSSNKAIITYEYPLYFGWPDGSRTLIQTMPAFPLIGLVLYLWFVWEGER